jgi:type II secretory pathway pseudopilin PulG
MSLIVALFLIVVLALLAAFAVTLVTGQREQENLALRSSRAQQAARAGAEWAGTRALRNNSCVAAAVLNLNQGALNGYRVTVNCVATPHSEGAVNYNLYDVTSFAQFGRFGASGYASSTVMARFTNAP